MCGCRVHQFCTCGVPVLTAAPKALLTMPSACEGPLTVGLTADSWKAGEPAVTKSFVLHDPSGAARGTHGLCTPEL